MKAQKLCTEIAQKIIEEYQLEGNNIRVLARKYNISRYIISTILKQANIKLKTSKEAKYEQFKIKIIKNNDLFKSDIANKIIKDYQLSFNNSRTLSNKYKIHRRTIIKILKHANVKLKIGSKVSSELRKKEKIKKNKELYSSNIGKRIIEEYQLFGVGVATLSKKYKLHIRKIKTILRIAGIQLKSGKEVYQEQSKLGLFSGKNNPMYGKKPPIGAGRCKWYKYNGNTYQGKYEFRFGLWLEHKKEEFHCHKNVKQFKYQIEEVERTYCPDFYLVKDNIFIEIKGYFSEKDKKKMNIVQQLYPHEIIKIYDKSILKELGVLDIDKRLNIELHLYEIKKNGSYRYRRKSTLRRLRWLN